MVSSILMRCGLSILYPFFQPLKKRRTIIESNTDPTRILLIPFLPAHSPHELSNSRHRRSRRLDTYSAERPRIPTVPDPRIRRRPTSNSTRLWEQSLESCH